MTSLLEPTKCRFLPKNGSRKSLFYSNCGECIVSGVKNIFNHIEIVFSVNNIRVGEQLVLCNMYNFLITSMFEIIVYFLKSDLFVQSKKLIDHILFLSQNLFSVGCAPKVRSH